MLRSILVPLDGSSFGEAALPLAASLASRTSARLHLVHVYDRERPDHLLAMPQFQYEGVDVAEYDQHYHDRDRAYLSRTAGDVGEGMEPAPVTALLDGPVVPALESYATDRDIDLVVMSTHGRTGLDRAWLGSVADGVIHGVSAPVLLVRPEHPGVGDPDHVQRILVPVDLTDACHAVLAPAGDLAEALGASLTLLHVVPTSLVLGARTYPIPVGHRKERRERAEIQMRDLASRFQGSGTVEVETREHSTPARGILEAAEESDADVIALATHGRSGVARAALGSVADKVLRGSESRVLLAARTGSAGGDRPDEG